MQEIYYLCAILPWSTIVNKEVNQYIAETSGSSEPILAPKQKTKARKAFVSICIVLGILFLFFGTIIGALHLKQVQTYIIGKVTNQLELLLNAEVKIAQFHYRPLSHLTIDSVYLSDQQYDTLAYIEQLELKFQPLELLENKINIQQLRLSSPYVNIQSKPDSTLNIQFLLELFKRDSVNFPFRVNIDQLQLSQTRVRYNDLIVDQLNLDLALPVFSKDSLDVQLHSLHLRAQLDRLDASFEANLQGNLDSIFAKDMQIVFRDQQMFAGDIALYQPIDLEQMQIRANCKDLFCSKEILQDIISQLPIKPVKIPKFLDNLGRIHYYGDLQGRIKHLDVHGIFTTALGAINVNGNLKGDTTFSHFRFYGKVATETFQLGRMFNHSDLGKISFQAQVDGTLDSTQLIYCYANANIKKLEYKGYTYKNISIDGEMRTEEVNGNLHINDENIQLNINGLADWSEQDTHLDLTIQLDQFRPATLNLTKQYPDLELGATAYVGLYTSGKRSEMLDNLIGHVIIDTLTIHNGEHSTTMEQLKLVADSEQHGKTPFHKLYIQSDFMTASISGEFRYQTLPATIQKMLHKCIPTLIPAVAKKIDSKNTLEFSAYLRNLERLSKVLNLGIELPSIPTIKGSVNEPKGQFSVQALIPYIHTSGAKMQDLTIALHNNDNQLDLSVFVFNQLPKKNPTAAKLGDIKANIYVTAKNDELDFQLQLGNTDSVRNEGKIIAHTKLSKYLDKPKFDIQILPTNFILNDSAWHIGNASLSYSIAEQVMDIQNFSLQTNYQKITANGRASKSSADSIGITLQNINLDYLLSYTNAKKAISIMGPVTGKAQVYSVFSKPMLEAQAFIRNGGLNGVYLGDVTAEAYLDRESKSILIDGVIVDSTKHIVAEVDGKVVPADKRWMLDIKCDSVDIHFIHFWTNGIIDNPQGRAYGRVKVEGEKQAVCVTGRALAKNAQVTVPQIGTTFYLTDSIFLDSTAIQFPNVDVYDQYGNPGVFDGAVYHNNFQNIRFDLRAKAKKMLVMDLPEDQQSFFYGKVFGTGDVHIYGNDRDCQIDVNAKTEANTKFYLNINSASQATNSSFIKFVQPDTSSHYLLSLLNQPQQTSTQTAQPESKLRLSLQGEVTPDANIHIKLGGEDGIKGNGEGNLKLVYESPSENVQMQGTYTLQSGQFSYSLGNIVRRNFTIQEGSKITWDSDPMAPVLDITGYYHTTASLRDLFGSESSQIATNRTSVPVNCMLHMTDQLFNPHLSFAIELPQSDESVQSQVRSFINTDEMLMRQVIYLLVFNRFYTPDYLQNAQNVGLNETYSLLSSTITGQINTWLSKLTDIFTMGFNFRTDGEGATASQEYEANFQIHPINQLIINGNFGYRYNDLSNRPFFGDLDIEYLLTENGKLRAKAYTHTVDKYSLRQANTVQGVGFVFKHDFNWGDKDDSLSIRKNIQKDSKSKKQKRTKGRKQTDDRLERIQPTSQKQ